MRPDNQPVGCLFVERRARFEPIDEHLIFCSYSTRNE